MKLFFAGVTHAGQSRVCEQIHMTLKAPSISPYAEVNEVK
jgi:hypothetical protein